MPIPVYSEKMKYLDETRDHLLQERDPHNLRSKIELSIDWVGGCSGKTNLRGVELVCDERAESTGFGAGVSSGAHLFLTGFGFSHFTQWGRAAVHCNVVIDSLREDVRGGFDRRGEYLYEEGYPHVGFDEITFEVLIESQAAGEDPRVYLLGRSLAAARDAAPSGAAGRHLSPERPTSGDRRLPPGPYGVARIPVKSGRRRNNDSWDDCRESAPRFFAARFLILFLLAAVALADLFLLAAQAVAFRLDAFAGALLGGAVARAAAELRLQRPQHVVHHQAAGGAARAAAARRRAAWARASPGGGAGVPGAIGRPTGGPAGRGRGRRWGHGAQQRLAAGGVGGARSGRPRLAGRAGRPLLAVRVGGGSRARTVRRPDGRPSTRLGAAALAAGAAPAASC